MLALAPMATRFVPWNASAMRPSAVVVLLNDITVNDRSCVVECGGGISTLFMARLLSARGGHLHTIEHDPNWAALLEAELRNEHLEHVASVITAPLQPAAVPFRTCTQWYDTAAVSEALGAHRPDLLVIDGPPAYDRRIRHARYPAVPFFAERLREHCTVVLDDIGRLGEQQVADQWERELGVEFERRLVAGSIAVGRRGPSYSI